MLPPPTFSNLAKWLSAHCVVCASTLQPHPTPSTPPHFPSPLTPHPRHACRPHTGFGAPIARSHDPATSTPPAALMHAGAPGPRRHMGAGGVLPGHTLACTPPFPPPTHTTPHPQTHTCMAHTTWCACVHTGSPTGCARMRIFLPGTPYKRARRSLGGRPNRPG
jgi:hypothetical protein